MQTFILAIGLGISVLSNWFVCWIIQCKVFFILNCMETLLYTLEASVWMQSTFVVSQAWLSSSTSSLLVLMGASLFCSHLVHCSCQHIHILRGTLDPLFHLTLSSVHAWARSPSHPTDTPAGMINDPLLGRSIHSAHCWEPLKQYNSCIPSSHWA